VVIFRNQKGAVSSTVWETLPYTDRVIAETITYGNNTIHGYDIGTQGFMKGDKFGPTQNKCTYNLCR
jgi:hypothetical protein